MTDHTPEMNAAADAVPAAPVDAAVPAATDAAEAAPPAPARFDTLPLDPKILAAIAYPTMTPIQAKAIPLVLAGRDVMGAAQTGTGKTAAFSIPLLQKMMKHENASMSPARHPVRAIVLAPTRELAIQVADNVKTYASKCNLRSAVVFGGMNMKEQTVELKAGVEVLIATPGRLIDHIEAKNCNLSQVEYVVLDEADRMLDIGFLPDLQRILSYLPKTRQTLLFSATFSTEIKKLAQSYLQDPVLVEVARPNQTATNVEQRFYKVDDDNKRHVIRQILRDRDIKQSIVFVNSKLGCARLARTFERDGLRTSALHGDKSQDERIKSLDAFKRGEVDLLVATDVAARGIDIAALPAVFNFDIPFNAEDYVHRIGRTGRAGASGLAVSLVTSSDARLMGDIEKLIKKKIDVEAFELQGSRGGDRSDRGDRGERSERPTYRRRDESFDDRPDLPSAGAAFGAPREAREAYAPRDRDSRPSRATPRRAPADPFFDKPYEPSAAAEPASWETKDSVSTAAAGNGLSRFIKPKRKVAALLGGSGTTRR
ncbi:superfamily II DNA/RNA helicase [Aquabacterium commune]|uniref:Superfamily II DNA/RNA helicase n=1 Tax=Aquabacterium commune TaxID=70586 RepID=A0A4R6R626_9BURK|nr:DEAD/DEAH box helicase [Aquabacterium commune]TDP81006.1 superfamily II DNA/RNA helicase [Aquabacterium commune]